MQTCRPTWIFLFSCGLLLFGTARGEQAATDPAKAKVSTFAPAKVAQEQLLEYVADIEKDLQNEAEFGKDQANRIALNASTVIVLAQTLGNHDEDPEVKKAAGAIIEHASEVSQNSDDFQAAKSATEELKQAISAKEAADPIDWEPTADLVLLMKQVPIVNNHLRRGVTGRRFKRSIEKTQGHAVTLAAIAHASMYDTSYCGDEEDEAEWAKICGDMRDACTEVYQALEAEDQEKAKVANEKIVATCDACHHKFR